MTNEGAHLGLNVPYPLDIHTTQRIISMDIFDGCIISSSVTIVQEGKLSISELQGNVSDLLR